jgi:hypothetical protein
MSKTKPTCKIEKITPDLARKYLEKNTRNRRVSETTTQRYTRAMKEGKWKGLNGEVIRFSKNGVLLDGQHRLTSIAKSGKPMETFVMRGLDEDAFTTIDIGKRRNAGDCLSIIGTVAHPNQVASSIRAVISYERKVLFMSGANALTEISNGDITERFLADSRLVADIQQGLQFRRVKRLMTPSLCGAFYYLLGKADSEKRDEFFGVLENPAMQGAEKPLIALHDKLMRDRGTALKPPQKLIANVVAVAWNAYYENRRLLKIHPSPMPDLLRIAGLKK